MSRWAGVRSWNSSTSSRRQRAWAADRAVGIGHQDLDGPVDLLVEVDGAPLGQGGPVAVEAVGHAGGVGHGLLDLGWGSQSQPDGGQGGQIGRHRVGVGLSADVEGGLDQLPHLGLLEDPGPAGPAPNSVQIHSPVLLRVRM